MKVLLWSLGYRENLRSRCTIYIAEIDMALVSILQFLMSLGTTFQIKESKYDLSPLW